VSRETENALLLLVGLSIGIITVTGAYTRYVKPSLLPWLAAAAALIILLALVAIVRDMRSGAPDRNDDGHTHRSAVAWLVAVPIVVLTFIVPPAIAARAVSTTVIEVSPDVLRHPYPPLPAGHAPTVSVPEVLMRVAYDTAGTLDRMITVTGFTHKDGGRTDLARVVIRCCAADAWLARIRLGGPAAADAARLPDSTWVSVEGKVPPGQGDTDSSTPPLMEVVRVVRIDPPANPYDY
jgi:uncharacterized repeat protein (TIGR03943 family)